MVDPWGETSPPATEGTVIEPLPERLADLAALTGRRPLAPDDRLAWPKAEELPEVRALAGDRWRPLDPAPLYYCLPAMWPEEDRCWVPDRLPKVSRGYDGSGAWVEPWDEETRRDMAEDIAREAAACGLPEPPSGRLWLVRSPWPSIAVQIVLRLLRRRCDERGLPGVTSGITETARELLGWPEDRVWEWWSGPDAEVARAWRARGRTGEDVAGLVLTELGPGDVAELGPGDVEPGLSEEQAVAWCAAVGRTGHTAISRIRGWRRLGFPADPPDEPVLSQVEPEEAAEWLAAGFDLADVRALRGLPLADAIGWRSRGFGSPEVRRLLEADRTLSPDEAAAFDAAGIGPDERLRWVEDGFDAGAARAWTDLGILPGEARVWRSIGQGPDDARPAGGGPLPSNLERLGWTATGGRGRAHRRYGVTDPPGTRGRTARRSGHGDRPPWRPRE